MTQTSQTIKFMFSNVTYRATVYKTGILTAAATALQPLPPVRRHRAVHSGGGQISRNYGFLWPL